MFGGSIVVERVLAPDDEASVNELNTTLKLSQRYPLEVPTSCQLAAGSFVNARRLAVLAYPLLRGLPSPVSSVLPRRAHSAATGNRIVRHLTFFVLAWEAHAVVFRITTVLIGIPGTR